MKRSFMLPVIVCTVVIAGLALLSRNLPLLAPDQYPDLAYKTVLLVVITSSLIYSYRGQGGEAVRHAATWAAIILILLFAYSLKDRFLLAEPVLTADGKIEIERLEDGHFHIDAEVNGRMVRFLIDTGASGVVLARADAERARLDTDNLDYNVRVSTANGITTVAPAQIERLRVGTIVIDAMPVHVAREGALDSSLLGMTFLDRLRAYRFAGDRLILEP